MKTLSRYSRSASAININIVYYSGSFNSCLIHVLFSNVMLFFLGMYCNGFVGGFIMLRTTVEETRFILHNRLSRKINHIS